MGTTGVIRTFLLVDIVVLALLALVYLRQRRMSWMALLAWGLVAVLVPILGPVLVISRRPGEWDPSFSLAADLRRIGSWVRRLLPDAAHAAKAGPRRQRQRR